MGAKPTSSSFANAFRGVIFKRAFAKDPNKMALAAQQGQFTDLFKAAGGKLPGEAASRVSVGYEGIGKPTSVASNTTLSTGQAPVEPSRRRAGPATSTNKRPPDDKKTLLGA